MISRLKLICFLLIVAACLVSGETASGRAGGGGGFGGGGGGGGGGGFGGGGGGGFGGGGFGGGGSGSGGGRSRPLSGTEAIISVVFLAIVVTVAIVSKAHARHSAPLQSGGPVNYATSREDQAVAEATIRASDPKFNAEGFLRRFSAAFLQIQHAWQHQSLIPVRHFVSDSIFERFTLQIQEQQAMGYRDRMEQIQILNALLAEATVSHVFEVMTVRVTASAIDYRVSHDTGEYLSGSRSPDQFTEFWSFLRRKGVQTADDKLGLIEGHCPNCGVAININQVGTCAHCDALLRSGEYDWVLSEITQACVWRPRSSQELGMARRYRERSDPGFNIQHLEDRASVIFWRKAMADRLGDTKPVLKMAMEGLCNTFSAEYRRDRAAAERLYFGGCSVGSVDLRGIVEEREADHALVSIQWSANAHGVGPGGDIQDHGRWQRFHTLYVLLRRKGVQTGVERAIHSAHCPTCGAPESDLASHACQFCDTVLNDGHHDWVLSECHALNSEAAQAWLAKARYAAPPEAASQSADPLGPYREVALSHADALAWTISVVAADKTIDDRERQVIEQLARKQRIPEPMVAAMIDAAFADELDAPAPPTPAIGTVWMEQMADIALQDGDVQPEERTILAQLGKKVGLAGIDVNLLINKRRAERRRLLRKGARQEEADLHPVYEILLESVCCVMASDGKASRAERDAIVDVLSKTGAALTAEEIAASITDFVARVHKEGYSVVLERCLSSVKTIAANDSYKRVFRRALSIVAQADDAVDPNERQIIGKFQSVLAESRITGQNGAV